MNKLVSFAVAFGISIVSFAGAQAMPFHLTQTELVIPIASACGFGGNRGPYNDCQSVDSASYAGYYGGYYRGYARGFYVGSDHSRLVNQGACSGRGMYRVCNIYGVCWAACN